MGEAAADVDYEPRGVASDVDAITDFRFDLCKRAPCDGIAAEVADENLVTMALDEIAEVHEVFEVQAVGACGKDVVHEAGAIPVARKNHRNAFVLERGEDWENCNLESYLRSFSVCVLEIRNAMENNNESVPEEATWEHFARILMTATYYE